MEICVYWLTCRYPAFKSMRSEVRATLSTHFTGYRHAKLRQGKAHDTCRSADRLEKQTMGKTGQTDRLRWTERRRWLKRRFICNPFSRFPVGQQAGWLASRRKMRVKNEKNIKIDAFDEGRWDVNRKVQQVEEARSKRNWNCGSGDWSYLA